jgi:L-ascorbate metabolism protein UlaG (beta-lactamase superfamily)
MKITKLGHCCLIIEEAGVSIMTDPGVYSDLQNNVKGIDYIFITHEHQDHFHLESLKTVLKNNPKAKIVTNQGVGKLLDEQKISYEILLHGGSKRCGAVSVEGCGDKHAVIYKDLDSVQNTGYFFANRFFYPGDALYDPGQPVEILALPVAGPWLKISEAIDYAKSLKPRFCFPVHDGMLVPFGVGISHKLPGKILTPLGVDFKVIQEGEACEF